MGGGREKGQPGDADQRPAGASGNRTSTRENRRVKQRPGKGLGDRPIWRAWGPRTTVVLDMAILAAQEGNLERLMEEVSEV